MKHSIQQGSLLDMPALERKEVKPSQPVTEKKMSRLEELIAELCPNGVEYRKLSDICGTITTGRLRACLETHLSIMKRFNSMLAMAI